MSYITVFFISSIFMLFLSKDPLNELLGVISALVAASLIIFILQKLKKKWLSYPLFFTISLTSLFGFTEVLTGSHAESAIIYFYGLSFYTASLAYLNYNQKISDNIVWKIANPLLLFTGPIILFFNRIRRGLFHRRLRHYLPFLIIGIFYFQVIGAPLSTFMPLINLTDIVSALVFAFIFELFVYANFCGLSLIIYSIFGIMGFRIPLNFRQPFSSSNLIDFWKGWHVTLSSVLKDLFYSPVRKKYGVFSALLAVYISSAMWHGITINFLLWGLFHTFCFYLTLLILKSNINFKKFFTVSLLFFGIVIGRLIFAESDTSALVQKLSINYDGLGVFDQMKAVPMLSKVALFMGVLMILIEFIFQDNRLLSKRTYKHLRIPIVQIILCLIIIVLVRYIGGDYAIYGQR